MRREFDPITQSALDTAPAGRHSRRSRRHAQRAPTVCCAASPAPTRASRPRRTGAGRSSIPTGRCSRRLSGCAAMRRRSRSDRSPASPTTSTPARPPSFAPCPPPASSTAIPSSARNLGHADVRTDRPGDRAAERNRRSARCRMRMRRACSSTTATCSASTSSRVGTAWKAAAAPMSACNTPPSSTRPAPSTCWSGSPIICSASTRLPSATRPIPAWTAASTQNRSDYVARVHLSAGPHLHLHLARALRRGHPCEVRRFEIETPRQLRPLVDAAAVRQLRCATGDRLPRPPARRARQRFGES